MVPDEERKGIRAWLLGIGGCYALSSEIVKLLQNLRPPFRPPFLVMQRPLKSPKRNLQEDLRGQVLRVAPVHTGQSFVLPSDLGPTPTSEGGGYRHLASQGIDTVLEIGVQRIALQASGRSTAGSLWSLSAAGLNPSLRLVVSARTRVIKVADGAELYAHAGDHQGSERTFTEWAANDAQAFREGLDQLMQNLAAEIVAQVFGVAVPPENNPAASDESDQNKEP